MSIHSKVFHKWCNHCNDLEGLEGKRWKSNKKQWHFTHWWMCAHFCVEIFAITPVISPSHMIAIFIDSRGTPSPILVRIVISASIVCLILKSGINDIKICLILLQRFYDCDCDWILIGFWLDCKSILKIGFGIGLSITYLWWIWIRLSKSLLTILLD